MKRRDIRLDTLRGFMLVIMAIDHVTNGNFITFQFLGYVSAAEGFVFISGLVTGLVYGKLAFGEPSSVIWRKALNRARDIYLSHNLMYNFILVCSVILDKYSVLWKDLPPLFVENPKMAFLLGVPMLYQPPFLDILPMYTVFLLTTPIVIGQLKKKRMTLVIGGSVFLWAMAQIGILKFILHGNKMSIDLGFFNIFAWQLLFFSGICISYCRLSNSDWSLPLRKWLILSCLGAVVIMFAVRHGMILLPGYEIPILGKKINFDLLVDRRKLSLLRLCNFIVVAYLISQLGAGCRWALSSKWFAFLGQHSLQVFTYQILVGFALSPFFVNIERKGWLAKILVLTAAILSLSLPAWLHRQYREAVKKRNG